MKKRKQLAENKKKEKGAKSQARKEKKKDQLFFFVSENLMQLKPDLMYKPNSIIPRILPKYKK